VYTWATGCILHCQIATVGMAQTPEKHFPSSIAALCRVSCGQPSLIAGMSVCLCVADCLCLTLAGERRLIDSKYACLFEVYDMSLPPVLSAVYISL